MKVCCPQGYVVTYAHVKACDHLTQDGTCFISGRPGDGKTTLAYEVLKKLSDENCHPVQLLGPEQCRDIPVEKLSDNYKLILLLDDVCGSGNLNDCLLERWSQELRLLKPYIREGLVRVLMTSRTHISKHFRGPDAASEEVLSTAPGLDLGDADFQLSRSEMKQILTTFLMHHDIVLQDDVNIESLMEAAEHTLQIGYPQICRFFAENKAAQADPVSYFSSPVAFLKKSFQNMKLYDEVSFLALILVISGEGALSHSYLNHEDNEQVWLKTAKNLGITEAVVSGKIIDKADNLCGTYLSFDSGTKTYTFTHDSLFDTLLLFLLKTDTEKALEICTAQQLNAYVRTEESTSDDQATVYRVSECEWPLLAARLVKEIILGDADLACSHPSLKNPGFVKVFEKALSEGVIDQMLSVQLEGKNVFDRYLTVTDLKSIDFDIDYLRNAHELFFDFICSFHCFRYHSPLSALLMNGCASPVRRVLTSQAFTAFPQDKKSSLLAELLTVACHTSDTKMIRFLTNKEAQPSVESVKAACCSQRESLSLVKEALGWSRGLPEEEVSKTLHDVAGVVCWNKDRPQTLRLVLKEIQARQAEASRKFDDIYTTLLFLTHQGRPRDRSLENQGPTHLAEILSVFREAGAQHNSNLDAYFIAGHGDVSTLKEFLEAQGDLTAPRESKATLLHVAARHGATANVRHLLHLKETAGAPLPQYVNALTEDGQSALHLAARYGHIAVIEILLQSGADAKTLDRESRSVLYLLSSAKVWKGLDKKVTRPDKDTDSVPPPATPPRRKQAKGEEFRSVLLTLVEASRDQVTASLHPAAKHGRTVLVELLLSHGADAKAEDYDGRTAFELALLHRRNDIAELLFPGGPSVSQSPGEVTSAEGEAGSMIPKRGGSLLHTAVEVGSLSFVKRLLTRGADIEARNRARETPVHLAARLGQVAIVNLLLRKGARIDAIDGRNRSLLHHVSESCGALSLVEKLLQGGADVNSQDVYRKTPLHLAAESGFLPLVHRFLQEGASVDLADEKGYTPLHYAAENGHLGIVQLLLKENADSEKQSFDDETALDLALSEKHFPIIYLLLAKGRQTKLFGQIGDLTALHDIAAHQHLILFADKLKKTVQQIVENLSHLIEKEDENGQTPIFTSLRLHNSVVTQELLKYNCNVNHQDRYGETPVFWVLWEYDASDLQKLIEHGCDIDHQNEAGESPIFSSLRKGATAAAQELIRWDCNLLLKNKRGDSVLHALAFGKNTEEVVTAVLQKASHLVDHENNDGDTPLLVALNNGNACVARQLLKTDCNGNQRNKKGDTPIFLAMQMGEQDIVEELLERNCDVSSKDDDGRTVLHALAERKVDNVELVRRLVKNASCLVNCQNKDGNTPLFIAIQERNDVLIAELLEYNDPSMSNGENDTALHILVRECLSTTETVKKIVSHASCCVNQRNKYGDTPVFIALMLFEDMVIQELLKQKCDLSLKNDDDDSVLHMLARQDRNDPETTAALIDQARFLLNHQNKHGETPVFVALRYGNDQVVRELLKQNCDTSITNNNSDTVLHAMARGYLLSPETMVEVLQRRSESTNRQNKDGDTPLLTALWSNNEAAALALLEHGCDASIVNSNNDTALHVAASQWESDPKIMTLLLERAGSLVNQQNKDGDTPLLTALREDKNIAALALLKHGCDASIVNSNNDTALHVATSRRRINQEIITLLLERAGNLVNQQNKDGDTPLLTSLRMHNEAVTLALLEHGCDTSLQNKKNNTALHVAASMCSSDPKIMTLLLERAGNLVNQQNKDGDTPLLTALREDNNIAALALLKHGCDASIMNNNSDTALHVAARCRRINREIATLLLERAGNLVNQQNKDGDTPLSAVVRKGDHFLFEKMLKLSKYIGPRDKDADDSLHVRNETAAQVPPNCAGDIGDENDRGEIIYVRNKATVRGLPRRLCDVTSGEQDDGTLINVRSGEAIQKAPKHACDINHQNKKGETLLMLAAQRGDSEMTGELLQRGCDVNLENKDGETALFAAVRGGNRGVVRDLLRRSCDVNHQNKDGETSLMLAVEEGNRMMTEELVKRGCDVNLDNKDGETALFAAVRGGDRGVVRDLLQRNFNVNHQNKDGETLLMLAVEEGNIVMTGKLLYRGCDVNLEDRDGETALFAAVRAGNAAAARDLLRRSCDVNHQNKDGETPLFLAVYVNLWASIRELLEHGGDTNHRNQLGDTPLLAAVRLGKDAATRELLQRPCSATAKNNSDQTVLHALAVGKLKNPETVASVVKFASGVIDSQDKFGNTSFLLAVLCQNTLVAVELLKENCDVSIRSSQGFTVLHVLAASPLVVQRYPAVNLYRSDWEGVVLKLEGLCRSANIDLNTPDRDGETPRDIEKRNQEYVGKIQQRYPDYTPPIHFLQQWRRENEERQIDDE